MKSINFKINYLSNYCEGGTGYEYYVKEKGPFPSTYLEFARSDLEDQNLTRSWVNSVGNSKRALHLQVELICNVFGWKSLHGKTVVGFPVRLDYLEKCGVISPGILAKLNKNRNKIEHDYYLPNSDEAEDYADIVELFIAASKSFLDSFPSLIEYELMDDGEYDKSLCLPKNIEATVQIEKGGIEIVFGTEKLKKKIKDSDYFEWLSAIMRQHQI